MNNNDIFGLETLVNSLKQTAEISKTNAESTSNILVAIDSTNQQLGIVTKKVTSIEDSVGNLTGRMTNIEQNEEVTTTQAENIRAASCKRIYEILGEDKIDHNKYFRTFIKRMYGDARRFAGLGSSIARTHKREYQRILEFIEGWNPSGGSYKLKSEIDEKAKAKLVARTQGYDC